MDDPARGRIASFARRISLTITGATLALAAVTHPAAAQQCDTIVSRTALSELAGERIGDITVRTDPPAALPGPLHLLGGLHFTTQASVIERHLLFDEGERLDTADVGESMRTLRAERYLSDVWLEAQRCRGRADVAITVHSVDAWTTRPRARLGGSGAMAAGLEERNLFGTARTLNVGVEAKDGRIGAGIVLGDPWMLHGLAAARLGVYRYRDGHEAFFELGTPVHSVFDARSLSLQAGTSARTAAGAAGDRFRRRYASVLGRWRVHASEARVVSLLTGAELLHAGLQASAGRALLGPATVDRRYAGLDVGAALQSASFDTLTWLLASHGIADVPRGLEGELLLGLGADLSIRHPVLHFDGWIGRAWLPDPDLLLTADAWASGFVGDDRTDATSLRFELNARRSARAGLWAGRFAAERLVNPDPDVRRIFSFDPLQAVLPSDARLAETAASLSVERQLDLMRLSRSWSLGGALFAAGAMRHDAAGVPSEQTLAAGVLGAGLRYIPRRSGRSMFRIDVGFPVIASPGVRRSLYVSFSASPGWSQLRQRDGHTRM